MLTTSTRKKNFGVKWCAESINRRKLTHFMEGTGKMIKEGDFVQYRTAQGEVKGYGIVVEVTEYWHVLVDQHTGEREHWCHTLMKRIDP